MKGDRIEPDRLTDRYSHRKMSRRAVSMDDREAIGNETADFQGATVTASLVSTQVIQSVQPRSGDQIQPGAKAPGNWVMERQSPGGAIELKETIGVDRPSGANCHCE